jgi:hypothetical protein
MTSRIDPVRPPYPPHIAERLDAMMPPGVPPILLFRTFVRNLPMTGAMSGWGGYELSKRHPGYGQADAHAADLRA